MINVISLCVILFLCSTSCINKAHFVQHIIYSIATDLKSVEHYTYVCFAQKISFVQWIHSHMFLKSSAHYFIALHSYFK